jgi:AmmeMemoRadiSam system protein A
VALLNFARGALLEGLASDTGPAVALPAPDPPEDPELLSPAGCFVSLHERAAHRLRGCVGRLDAKMPLWQTVCHTARDVLRDPRFVTTPVRADEVWELEIEVSVLSPPREAASPLDFDPLIDGIYLIHDNRSGFFLPQVARETGWSKEHLLCRLCTEKLGAAADAWQSPDTRLFTFQVEVVGPEPV